jgi:hypothetical protein
MLRTMGYSWRVQGRDDYFEILIWNDAKPPSRADQSWNPPC